MKATQKKMKMMTLDQIKDKHIGEVGSSDREKYEFDLRLEAEQFFVPIC